MIDSYWVLAEATTSWPRGIAAIFKGQVCVSMSSWESLMVEMLFNHGPLS